MGKKKIDKLLDDKIEEKINQKYQSNFSIYGLFYFLLFRSTANTWRDTQSKIREDPLLTIKKKEQVFIYLIIILL